MGAVSLVEHLHTGDELALKMLHAHVNSDPGIVELFKREARAPARIKSEPVVKVIDADVATELGDVPFLVMERLNGEDYEKIIRRRGPLPSAEILSILR